jgi:hypothetical protein
MPSARTGRSAAVSETFSRCFGHTRRQTYRYFVTVQLVPTIQAAIPAESILDVRLPVRDELDVNVPRRSDPQGGLYNASGQTVALEDVRSLAHGHRSLRTPT